jgi:sugar phosphate isomerase/epimerase
MLQLKKAIRLESLNLPLKRAMQVANELGFEAVELNARTQLRPSELSRTGVRHFRKLMEDLNLKVSAIHFPTRRGYNTVDDLDRRIDATKSTMEMAYQLGCNVVCNHVGVVPEDPESEQWHTLIQALTDLGNYSHKAGAWLAAKTGSEDGARLKGLLDVLPLGAVGVDFDPGNLIINGFSASESMDSLGDRVLMFRARDAVRDLATGRGLEVQLGRGSIDLPHLLSVLEENQYRGFVTVERQTEADSVVECREAIEYLQNVFG